MAPTLSILIITYNRPEDTLALLQNLATQEALQQHVLEILLLNNASTVPYDIVTAFIQKRSDLPINYIDHDENLGVARGRNFLVQKAKAPYLLVLDDDVEFASNDAIVKAAAIFDKPHFKEHNTAIVTLNIFYFDTRARQRTAFPHKQMEALQDKPWFLTYYFTGAAHMMHRALFDKTGLYPEDFFYGMEEYDLSYRAIDAGYTLAYDNSVVVLHKESATGRVTNKQKLAMMWLNKSKVAWRYLPKKYFYSTVAMWALQYLKKTGFDLGGFFGTLKKISGVPANNKRSAISGGSLDYLRKVKARLWF
ncbi:glycosyltransferase family 2 protein [Taibaiella chishuiensis]|uniref:GT2 family glycosyltransferase n=1 Tax=Taibaiella chishuiensis TaxID=1434707 RepID=A0A2P8D099_9BACT|nr:glycosyltransferase family 2 protein [Taibaiella chishuiensis]PSK90653.1 GT2 family glycosyltransferase [Taibaiella chishuiensis]